MIFSGSCWDKVYTNAEWWIVHERTGGVKSDIFQAQIEDLHTHYKLNKFGAFEKIGIQRFQEIIWKTDRFILEHSSKTSSLLVTPLENISEWGYDTDL